MWKNGVKKADYVKIGYLQVLNNIWSKKMAGHKNVLTVLL